MVISVGPPGPVIHKPGPNVLKWEAPGGSLHLPQTTEESRAVSEMASLEHPKVGGIHGQAIPLNTSPPWAS